MYQDWRVLLERVELSFNFEKHSGVPKTAKTIIMTSSEVGNAVNMKGLYVGASTMESMFKSFSTRLDKLSAKVETLASESAMKESQNEAMKRFGIVMDKLQGLEERISLVEKALAVQHPDGHMLPFSQVGNTITSVLQDVKQAAEQLIRKLPLHT